VITKCSYDWWRSDKSINPIQNLLLINHVTHIRDSMYGYAFMQMFVCVCVWYRYVCMSAWMQACIRQCGFLCTWTDLNLLEERIHEDYVAYNLPLSCVLFGRCSVSYLTARRVTRSIWGTSICHKETCSERHGRFQFCSLETSSINSEHIPKMLFRLSQDVELDTSWQSLVQLAIAAVTTHTCISCRIAGMNRNYASGTRSLQHLTYATTKNKSSETEHMIWT
jgi:hypothetical protein